MVKRRTVHLCKISRTQSLFFCFFLFIGYNWQISIYCI
nr:MAG TPA: hypothetical protein [Caudoviricetes sp.]